jgi:hypothetical protein
MGVRSQVRKRGEIGFDQSFNIHTPLYSALISILFHLRFFSSVATKNFLRQKNIGKGALATAPLKLRQCLPICGIRRNAGADSGRHFWSSMTGCTLCICMTINLYEKKVHFIIQINQPTRCNIFSSLLLDVYVQLNMFRASSRPSSGAQQLQ